MKLRRPHPEALSTSMSMLGNGYESFGQALLRSEKSPGCVLLIGALSYIKVVGHFR